jgi:hypothetical protein
MKLTPGGCVSLKWKNGKLRGHCKNTYCDVIYRRPLTQNKVKERCHKIEQGILELNI